MDRYDVIVQALDEGVDPAAAARPIAQALGTSAVEALARLETLPATVREDVDEREAESLLHALRAAGVRVRLKKRSPSRTALPRAASSVPPPSRSVRPRPMEIDLDEQLPLPELPRAPRAPVADLAPVATAVAAAAPDADPHDEILPARFWTALPGALVYPLRGPGWRFLAIGALLSPLLPIALVIASFVRIWGGGLLIAVSATWLGYLLVWYRACCFGAMTGGAEPEELPHSSTWRERIQEGGFLLFVIGGLGMLGALVTVSAERGAAGLVDAGTQGIALLVLYGLVFLYWPLGIGLLTVRESLLAFFDFAVAVRALTQVPVQMLAVIAVSVIAQGLAVVALVAVGQAAAMMSTTGWIVVVALAALPSAYVHAVMGTAMGLLFRVKPDVFT